MCLYRPCQPPALEDFPEERVRNFSIVAHIDHGKSTLADRLLENTGTYNTASVVARKHTVLSSSRAGVIEVGGARGQVLDHLPVERKRGITVKAQTASMVHQHAGHSYLLNLIDTPVRELPSTIYVHTCVCLSCGSPILHLSYNFVVYCFIDRVMLTLATRSLGL